MKNSVMELFLSIGCVFALGANNVATTEIRRGPHHPREAPLPPGTHPRHYKPSDSVEKLTQDSSLLHDTAHIQEDIGRPLNNMTDEELEFHYFKLHDFDNNKLLDGLEMLKAIYHTMDHDHEEDSEVKVSFMPTEEEVDKYIELVDKVLENDDLDHDGFISYPEFVLGRSGSRSVNSTSNYPIYTDNPE